MWKLIFGLLWGGIKAFFGKSDKEKLGIAETVVTQQAKVLEEVNDAQNLVTKFDGLSDSALRMQTGQWKRPTERQMPD